MKKRKRKTIMKKNNQCVSHSQKFCGKHSFLNLANGRNFQFMFAK